MTWRGPPQGGPSLVLLAPWTPERRPIPGSRGASARNELSSASASTRPAATKLSTRVELEVSFSAISPDGRSPTNDRASPTSPETKRCRRRAAELSEASAGAGADVATGGGDLHPAAVGHLWRPADGPSIHMGEIVPYSGANEVLGGDFPVAHHNQHPHNQRLVLWCAFVDRPEHQRRALFDQCTGAGRQDRPLTSARSTTEHAESC